MSPLFQRITGLSLLIVLGFIIHSCTRNEITFGTISDEAYTELVQVDTVWVDLSTVFRDLFETSNVSGFLLGRYQDPYMGTITGSITTQITTPGTQPDIPESAVFDSLVLIMRGNQYYYGDTTQTQQFTVYELANSISYSYNSQLYNTSSTAVRQPALGSRTLSYRPLRGDSLAVRLSDALGAEWLDKIRLDAAEMQDETSFLNYFKGISVTVAAGDMGAVYGIRGSAGDIVLRLFYHTVYPYKESHSIDFTNLQNDLQYNQLLHDRTGTGLVAQRQERTEISSILTGNRAMTQPGMSIWMKATFPGLRSLLIDRELVKLLKAELILRPAHTSFNDGGFRLPRQLYLQVTDASNLDGSQVYDSTGTSILYVDPVTDPLYGENTHYRFNVTNYVAAMLSTPGSETSGFIIRNQDSVANLTRLVVNDRFSGQRTAELRLQVLIIEKN